MSVVGIVLFFFAVALGLAFGSFLNVCILRLPQRESLVRPGSHCRVCLTPIAAKDNIPVLSWLLLRGKCRTCKSRISPQYPIVELATALLFAACVSEFGATLAGAAMAIFCALLLGLALIDAETLLLPDALTLPGIVLGIAYNGGTPDEMWPDIPLTILGIAAIGGLLLVIALLYKLARRRAGMGFGDVKLGCMLGAWLGWQMGAVALFLAIVGGAIGGIVLLILEHRKRADASLTEGPSAILKTAGRLRIPFGAFLAGTGILTVFAGNPLLHWYLGWFSS